MIQIAICDDEDETLTKIAELVFKYGTQNKVDISIDTYNRAKDLEKALDSQRKYQIYILDMLMPQMSGIEIGQRIRSQDRQASIICLTSSKDFAYQAFGIYAQRYLLKPADQEALFEAMDFAVGHAREKSRVFHVNTADGIQGVLLHDIEYVENSERMLHIFLADGREVISRFLRKSFESSLAELLENGSFLQVHKSFLVNLSCVGLYEASQMTMRSGMQIPISKSRQAQVKRAYLKYMSESY